MGEYIHRVGRTARGANTTGKALRFLRATGVSLNEYSFPANKICNVQAQLERLVEKNYHLHKASRDAYRSYLHAYAAHSLKECFNVSKLDLAKVAKCFGFSAPPKIELNLKHKTARDKQKKPLALKSARQFSADNPYGKAGGE